MRRKKVSEAKAARIFEAAEIFVDAVSAQLTAAGFDSRILIDRCRRTGSIYLLIRVYVDGIRVKGVGACVRVSDHRKPGDRWANFSRPARRFYGIWYRTKRSDIEAKAARIVGGIVRRYASKSLLAKGGAV